MKAVAVILSSIGSGALQIATYLIGYFASGTSNLPQPAISLGSTWTSVIMSLLGRFLSPTLSNWGVNLTQISWLPTAINLVGGWIILGLALLGAFSLFKGLLTGALAAAVIILLVLLVFGLKLPVLPFPTNSTIPTTG